MYSLQLQAKVSKLTAELKEEKEVCFCGGGREWGSICFYFCLQMNKCLSDNQKTWRDRVSELEKKIDVTIQQKEQVHPSLELLV